jgi:hypothetical protein
VNVWRKLRRLSVECRKLSRIIFAHPACEGALGSERCQAGRRSLSSWTGDAVWLDKEVNKCVNNE